MIPTNFNANIGNFGNYRAASNSILGGNIVTIAIRQAIRLRAATGAAAFKAARRGLIANAQGQAFITNPIVAYAGIPISVKTQEVYTYDAVVTEHATEEGSILSDHVIKKPILVVVSFGISNWSGGEGLEPLSSYALDILEAAWNQRIPVELETAHKKIPNMVLQGFSATNALPDWRALTCRATFKQVKPVVLQTVIYPESKVAYPTEDPVPAGPTVLRSATPTKQIGTAKPADISTLRGWINTAAESAGIEISP